MPKIRVISVCATILMKNNFHTIAFRKQNMALPISLTRNHKLGEQKK